MQNTRRTRIFGQFSAKYFCRQRAPRAARLAGGERSAMDTRADFARVGQRAERAFSSEAPSGGFCRTARAPTIAF